MTGRRRRLALWAAVGVLAVIMAMPAYGAPKRKKITSISLDISAEIEPDTDFGMEQVEIGSDSNKYEVEGYEVLNSGFTWQNDMTPLLRITLRAQENYYFVTLAKDRIHLKGGASPVRSARQDSASTLLLDVKLPSLHNVTGTLERVSLNDQGFASWQPVANAGSYEVRVYRDGNAVGTRQITKETTMNCRDRMLKGNTSYTVKVRPLNQYDEEILGDWCESSSVYITGERSAQFRDNPEGVPGQWKQEPDGRWWYLDIDGSWPKNEWKEIAGKWYFFGEDGYMKTGWIQWQGKEYYCSENGTMLTNCFTPDAYLVGEDGAKIAQ